MGREHWEGSGGHLPLFAEYACSIPTGRKNSSFSFIIYIFVGVHNTPNIYKYYIYSRRGKYN